MKEEVKERTMEIDFVLPGGALRRSSCAIGHLLDGSDDMLLTRREITVSFVCCDKWGSPERHTPSAASWCTSGIILSCEGVLQR